MESPEPIPLLNEATFEQIAGELSRRFETSVVICSKQSRDKNDMFALSWSGCLFSVMGLCQLAHDRARNRALDANDVTDQEGA